MTCCNMTVMNIDLNHISALSLLSLDPASYEKIEKDLSEKTQNVTQLKKDMGAQRKKTHSAQEELKALAPADKKTKRAAEETEKCSVKA